MVREFRQAGKNSSEDKFIHYADYPALIDKAVDEFTDTKAELKMEIQKVSKLKYSKLLYLYYIDCLAWRVVAERLDENYSTVKGRMHDKAVKAFEKVMQNK